MIQPKEVNLVYDTDICDENMTDLVSTVYRLLSLCLRVSKTSLKNWDHETNDGLSTAIHIASLDTEEFHSKIKVSFLKQAFSNFLILVHSKESEIYIKRLEAGVKIVMKKKEQNSGARKAKIREMLSNVVFVSDLNQTLLWWPRLLKFVQSLNSEFLPRDIIKREIGIFFKLDPEDGKQYEWYEKQKYIFETLFRVQCCASASEFDEEKYIAASNIVVMYVHRSKYQSSDPVLQKERKLRMFQDVKDTQSACARLNTKFHLVVNEAGESFTNHLKQQGLKVVGSGILQYCIELLHLLGKLDIKRKKEQVVYSSTCNENARVVFSMEDYPELLLKHRSKTPRLGIYRDATMGDILMQQKGYLKDVCFQPSITDDVTSDDDHVTQPCCAAPWLRCVK